MWNPIRSISKLFGGKAKIEAAGNGKINREHWKNADTLGPNASISDAARCKVRSRARHERQNNAHLSGLNQGQASDLIGTGPRLNLIVPSAQADDARLVEKSWCSWVRAVNMAETFRIMTETTPVDGECFGQFITNPNIRHVIKLDMKLLEGDQVATPFTAPKYLDMVVDGIEFDAYGQPSFYHVLKFHPGENVFGAGAYGDYDRVPASRMVHWFRPFRPGQARGISHYASALNVAAQTRRYSEATLTNAEMSARINAVITSTNPDDTDPLVTQFQAMEEVDLPSTGALMQLPYNRDVKSLAPSQPVANHNEYVSDRRAEVGRAIGAPRSVATGNSSDYNFSSVRMENQGWGRNTWVERDRLRNRVVDRLFLAWVQEALLVGLIPESLAANVNEWEWDWHWDSVDAQLDPLKETNAIAAQLDLGLTNLAEQAAAQGKNWQEVLTQRAREVEFAASLGLMLGAKSSSPAPAPMPAPMEDPTNAPVDPGYQNDG